MSREQQTYNMFADGHGSNPSNFNVNQGYLNVFAFNCVCFVFKNMSDAQS